MATTEMTEHRRAGSPARRRILDTAAALFYAEGIHAVGVDRVIAEAGVAKATFYHHFPSKDELVRAYLQEQSDRVHATTVPRGDTPQDRILSVFDDLGDFICGPGFRGCAFVNAAAEYPDPDHPVRRVVAEHRAWFHGVLRDLLTEAGRPEADADRTAAMLAMLRDGLVVAGDLDDPAEARTVAREAVMRLLG
ncbi:TetR/AcrR family transcriptional regulator [Actinoallomurus iriomotensis]|uniref:TetR family transcriptional regulator n=1 Tax=Actinoallomurus iriomotensis TaxID=478107 RepID=A0A9W6SBP0_9ACTN|nr:TetR/AcrR family transcriptional regulator [Actinoallomurus iriomotensis]GLY90934.1 TetR family transcriptional regulator [Actinoallomurus iriomotensis]